jgi:hypothetical protein
MRRRLTCSCVALATGGVDFDHAFVRLAGVAAMRSEPVWQRTGRCRIPFEFGLAAGSLAVVVAALIDSAAFSPDHRDARLAVMAAVVAAFCAVAGWRSGLPVAAVGFLLFDGFLANRYGELTWDHKAGPGALGVIALAAALGLVVGWLRARSYRAALVIRRSIHDRSIDNTAIDVEKKTRGG